jgi:hypothetical protein
MTSSCCIEQCGPCQFVCYGRKANAKTGRTISAPVKFSGSFLPSEVPTDVNANVVDVLRLTPRTIEWE